MGRGEPSVRQESTEKPEPVPASQPNYQGLIQRLMTWPLFSGASYLVPSPLRPFFPLQTADVHSPQHLPPVPFLRSGSANGQAGRRESMVHFHGCLPRWDSDNGRDGLTTSPSAGSPRTSSPAELSGLVLFLYTWPLLY